MDFGLFFFQEPDEFIVLLDGFEGLDIDRLTGGTGAVDDAGDAALELAAHRDDEAVAADGDEVFLRGAFAGELAERGAEGIFDDALLAFLLAADAAEFGRGVVGKGAVGEDLALDVFRERAQADGQGRGELGEAGELAGEAGGRLAEERLPGGDIVGEAGDGLEFGGFECGFGNLGFGGELGGVEKAAEGDGDLLFEQKANFAGELVLAGDPGLVGRGLEGEDGGAADGARGESGNEGQERFPLECGAVGVGDGRRDGVEERHRCSLMVTRRNRG